MALVLTANPPRGLPRGIAALDASFNHNAEGSFYHSVSKRASRASHRSTGGITSLPVETLLSVFEKCDMRSAFALAMTNKTLKSIYDSNWAAVILPALREELSPFDDILQFVVATSEPETHVPRSFYRRNIYYEGKLLSGRIYSTDNKSDTTVHLNPNQLKHCIQQLLSTHRVVHEWERLYTTWRFTNPADCRGLRFHEGQRLRAAVYRWMSYAHYFHGDFPRPRYIPRAYSSDPRCSFLRQLSDAEILELEDLWMVVRIIVEQKICPSVEFVLEYMVSEHPPISKRALADFLQDYSISKAEAYRIAFGSSTPGFRIDPAFDGISINQSVVETVLKLSPAKILELVEVRFSKVSLLRKIQIECPGISKDWESLSLAIKAITEERGSQHGYSGLIGDWSGGILDHDDEDLDLREAGSQSLNLHLDEDIDLIVMPRGCLDPDER